MLPSISLKELLKLPQQSTRFTFREMIPDFESLNPVHGRISVRHRGHFLEAQGEAETIVTLTCHRCLQQFNYRLTTEFEEILWIEGGDQPPADDLVEVLPAQGQFDTGDWVYQHLCLALPQRHPCRPDCQPPVLSSAPVTLPDQRWAALHDLKNHLDCSSL